MLEVQKFEPVYLEFEGPLLPTEVGKRWLDRKFGAISKFWDVLTDNRVITALKRDMEEWDPRMVALADAGLPMMASGVSQGIMQKVLDYLDGLTTTAFSPATTNMGIAPTAPTSTTTGTTFGDGTSNYTGYARFVSTPATYFNASTGATPSVVTTKAQIQFAACTGGSAVTENGFMIADSSTTNAGTAYFFGSITAVTISTTQTPPTIASGSLSISMNTT